MNKFTAFLFSKKVKTTIFLLLTILYLAGIIAMFFNFALGVLFWGAALIPSLIIFLFQKQNERARQTEEAEKAKDN